jgi:hypothetical protein
MTPRRFPPPWRADPMPGGYVVRDANGQALAYLYSRDNEDEARQAKVLTKDEARRIAIRAGEPDSCCQLGKVHMPPGPRLFILVAAAGLDPASQVAAEQTVISNAREVRAALQACWVAPKNGVL